MDKLWKKDIEDIVQFSNKKDLVEDIYNYIDSCFVVKDTAYKIIHQTQKDLMCLAEKGKLDGLSLREIASKIGLSGKSPELIRHHLKQLKKCGRIEQTGYRKFVIKEDNENM